MPTTSAPPPHARRIGQISRELPRSVIRARNGAQRFLGERFAGEKCRGCINLSGRKLLTKISFTNSSKDFCKRRKADLRNTWFGGTPSAPIGGRSNPSKS